MQNATSEFISLSKGLGAGFIATLALSSIMMANQAVKARPQLDAVEMLSTALQVGKPTAWAVHFAIGTVGYSFAIALLSRSPDKIPTMLGLRLGVMGWLITMITVMPLATEGLFGMRAGIIVPAMTLLLHLIFGAVLGWVYSRMVGHTLTHDSFS